MFCPRCGRAVPDDASFCPACGNALAPAGGMGAPGPAPAGSGVPEAAPSLGAVGAGTPSPPVPAGGFAAPAAAPAPAAPAVAAAGVRYGGFWRRLWALVIDSILLAVVMWPVRAMMGLTGLSMLSNLNNERLGLESLVSLIMAGMAVNMLGAAVAWIYFALLESSPKQATVGKMVLGLRVTDMNGRRISFLRATGRYFASFLSTLILCIGYLMVAFTEKKQGLHDMIASTLVVRQSA